MGGDTGSQFREMAAQGGMQPSGPSNDRSTLMDPTPHTSWGVRQRDLGGGSGTVDAGLGRPRPWSDPEGGRGSGAEAARDTR